MRAPSHLRQISRTPEWHLTKHFFGAMFDFGILTPAGADSFTHLLLGAVGALIATGLGATRIYAGKYAALSGGASTEPYRTAVLGDDLFLVALAMLLVALLTLLVSQSLFPDERDFRILGPLPVRRIVIFGAKLTAVLLFAGLFVAVLHLSLVPVVLLTSVSRFSDYGVLSRVAAWLVASVASSLFSILAMSTAVGGVALALSRTRLHSLTAATRSILLALLVVCVPFVFRLPNAGESMAHGSAWWTLVPAAWFVGLERVLLGTTDTRYVRLAEIALAGIVVAAAIVVGVYVLLFKRFEHLLLRPPSTSAWRFGRNGTSNPSNVTEQPPPRGATVTGSQARRGVFRFVLATFGRSQLHQGVLLGVSACGGALAVNRLVGANLWGRAESQIPTDSLMYVALWAPFALMFVCGISMRAAIALPMSHRANWIFRLTENDATRGEQMRAVDRIVTLYAVALPVAAASPVFWLVLPTTQALVASLVVALIGTVFAHGVLLEWRRIPFTCSYLPGKRLVVYTVVPGFAAFVLFIAFSVRLVQAAIDDPIYAVIIGILLALVSWVLRRRRIAEWKETPLMFDDELPNQPLQLGL